MTDAAPLFTDIARAPKGGRAQWRICSDGVRIRVATWKKGTKGTILVFPGRSEFIEKYGPTVQYILDMGFSAAVVDWRGQGISDRISANHQLGHVKHFLDYQKDVDEVLNTVKDAGLPDIHTLLSHSMGGTIALRALHNGLQVKKTVFSAPMWGIYIEPVLRIPAQIISNIGPLIGFARKFSPNTTPNNYVQENPFETNTLTNDKETYQWMISQLNAHPELGIGGPSINWLHQALLECARLRRLPPPEHDCLCLLGSQEAIVSPNAINRIMAEWTNGKLVSIDGAQHEVLMEIPDVLDFTWAEIDRFLSS
ncbi:MAG: alpha/beta hydrolase [Amylibacter sp.]